MVYRLEFASSLMVATTPVELLAVRPSHLPRRSHWRITEPQGVNSTIVLSRFPSVLACPCGPTPFWKVTNSSPPSVVMSSGLVSRSQYHLFDPALVYQWCRLWPDKI